MIIRNCPQLQRDLSELARKVGKNGEWSVSFSKYLTKRHVSLKF